MGDLSYVSLCKEKKKYQLNYNTLDRYIKTRYIILTSKKKNLK